MAFGNRHVGVDQAVQIGGQTRNVGHLGVVGEVHGRRLLGLHAGDGRVHRVGLELHRRGGRENARPAIHVELTIGQAKSVAGKEAAAGGVEITDVMTGMARRVENTDHPPGQRQLQPFGGFDHAIRRHRDQFAVQRLGPLRAIHGRHAGKQLGRLNHVACAAGVHHQLRIRKSLHEGPGPARVIEVDVGQQHVIHGLGRQPCFLQCLLHVVQRRVVTGIHQRRPAAVFDQVDRRHTRPRVSRIDGINSVPESPHLLHRHPLEKKHDSIHSQPLEGACEKSILRCAKKRLMSRQRDIKKEETSC